MVPTERDVHRKIRILRARLKEGGAETLVLQYLYEIAETEVELERLVRMRPNANDSQKGEITGIRPPPR
jgi:hypothetical protein